MKKSIWLLIGLILVAVDQSSKWAFVSFFPEYVSYNSGSAFSLAVPQLLTICLSFIVLFIAIYMQGKDKYDLIWLLLFAGAYGNLIDRLAFGEVIDFIDLGFWPVFNIADTYLSIAAILLIWFYVINERRTKK